MNPISPTSLKLYLQCPALYRARYVDKLYAPESNRFLERGIRVHKLLEDEVAGRSPDWSEERAVYRNVKPVLDAIDAFRKEGFGAETELDAAVNGMGEAVGWWDESAVYRSKIDLLLANRRLDRRVIVDWKTGKTPGDPLIQLAFNAMCLYPHFGSKEYDVLFVYVDQGRSEHFKVRGGLGNGWLVGEDGLAVDGLAYRLTQVESAHGTGNFPATPNERCRWCEWKGCGKA